VETTVERAGRSVTTLSARLLQAGRTYALALAAFVAPRQSFTFVEAAPPTVPPPEAAAQFRAPAAFPAPFTEHYEYRWAVGDLPFSGSSASRVGGWMRLAEPRLADALLLAAFTDSWVPCLFPRLSGPIGAPTLDLTIHFRSQLPLSTALPDDFYLCAFSSQLTAEGAFDEHGEIWSRDGLLLAQSHQIALVPTLRGG
jgi:acyl-CoA thioesterase